jgi:hypothetical protein
VTHQLQSMPQKSPPDTSNSHECCSKEPASASGEFSRTLCHVLKILLLESSVKPVATCALRPTIQLDRRSLTDQRGNTGLCDQLVVVGNVRGDAYGTDNIPIDYDDSPTVRNFITQIQTTAEQRLDPSAWLHDAPQRR